ncbi:putative transcriptional regulator [Sphingomonas zeicaulis]|uniref:MucR family transcriptional regulator n=1 Tax=Sphingomonas zeicaulis TaxID=1632740 RepID=UPI003D1FBD1A
MSDTSTLTQLTADIAAAFVSNNRVAVGEIGGLIGSVHDALAKLGGESVPAEPEYVPAVTARKSLADPTRIISMIDGKPYSSLKRHLSSHGLTPEQYRQRYALPPTYPMVAPAYSELRKTLAKKLGLGRKPKAVEAAPVEVAAPAPKRARKPRAAAAEAPAAPVVEAAAAPKPARKPRAKKAD